MASTCCNHPYLPACQTLCMQLGLLLSMLAPYDVTVALPSYSSTDKVLITAPSACSRIGLAPELAGGARLRSHRRRPGAADPPVVRRPGAALRLLRAAGRRCGESRRQLVKCPGHGTVRAACPRLQANLAAAIAWCLATHIASASAPCPTSGNCAPSACMLQRTSLTSAQLCSPLLSRCRLLGPLPLREERMHAAMPLCLALMLEVHHLTPAHPCCCRLLGLRPGTTAAG